MSIEIEEAVLKKACMEMIDTIFVCLPNAFKGTIYKVGKMPDLKVERITSGIVDEEMDHISWGLPAQSEYNPPGKPWIDYRDEPGIRPLEAMAWCVERQKSWTAEDPENDSRSVRLQMESGLEDFQHMEPVLVRKSDISLDMYSSAQYPKNYRGETIWNDSDYIVVAVIKIHFRPYTIKMNSYETRVIKKLSRSLGTELLSYQLRQDSMKAMQSLSRDRLNACNILADSLRNAITKSGLIFTLVKQEIGRLRDQWEEMILKDRNEINPKVEGLNILNHILENIGEHGDLIDILKVSHNRFLELSLPPVQGEKWIRMQIEEKWNELLNSIQKSDNNRNDVYRGIDALKRSLRFGSDPKIVSEFKNIPEKQKSKLVGLLYKEEESLNTPVLDKLIDLLDDPQLNIPSREKSRKSFIQLKALWETMNQLERNTNFLLHQVLNGNGKKDIKEKINDFFDAKEKSDFPDLEAIIKGH